VAARLAGQQAGALRWSQLRESGVGAGAIKHRARNGHLHRIHRGVYIVGHTALANGALETAALLACGDGAVISHWSAAHLWGLLEVAPARVDVTLIGRHCRAKHGVHLHTISRIDPSDVRRRRRIPLTAPARTLIDLAAGAGFDVLESLVAEARVLKLVRAGELERALERAGRRRGVGQMKAFLRQEGGPILTRSEGERAMRRLTRAAGLPAPVANTRVAGWEVDFLWPTQRLVVEVDGYQFHGHRAAFERDRRKGLALAAAGYRVIRVSWRQLVHQPLAVAAQLALALARGS
jgi:very-short-patch-repair endonuclease